MRAFQRRHERGYLVCADCGYSEMTVGWCTRNRRDITWDPYWYGCEDYCSRLSEDPGIITEDRILRDGGRLGRRPCCFQCRHRVVVPLKDAPFVERDASGTTVVQEQRHRIRICIANPQAVNLHGLVGQVCGLFELDTGTWWSVSEQWWEHDLRIRQEEERNAARIAAIRGRGYAVLEDWIE